MCPGTWRLDMGEGGGHPHPMRAVPPLVLQLVVLVVGVGPCRLCLNPLWARLRGQAGHSPHSPHPESHPVDLAGVSSQALGLWC